MSFHQTLRKNPVYTTEITLQNINLAKKRISSSIPNTPLLYSFSLSKMTGKNVYLKCENLHPSGAFKMRGAINAIQNLSEEQKNKGVTTYSTGNHGLAIAMSATKLGIRSVICVSNRVPSAKVELIRQLGAEVEIYGEGQDFAEQRCYELQREQGLTLIPPFDHPDVIAGQGTMALEILEELPNVDCIIGGLSGGGMMSGIGLVCKHYNPDIEMIGVSMEKGAAMFESLKAQKPVAVEEHMTLADSLLGGIGMNNQYTLPLIQQYIDQVQLISEATIAKGMAHIYQYHKMIVEGAAGITAGALLENPQITTRSNVVLIISGCNVDIHAYQDAIKPYLT